MNSPSFPEKNELVAHLLTKMDDARKSRGFMTLSEIAKLLDTNTFLDPLNVLISNKIRIGVGNIIYPHVILEATENGSILIGNKNIFYPNTFILATNGDVVIGNQNEFGDGGVTIKANAPGSGITIDDNCRLMNGVQLLGKTHMGNGTQMLGQIVAQNCELEGGVDYKNPDAALRGGLLKGFGTARNCQVPQGKVLVGDGSFSQDKLMDQIHFHPPKK